jgi:hypothetical protein
MPADRLKVRAKSGMKSARMRDVYRKILQTRDLSDQEIDDVREHMIQLAQTLCEHVWGKRFY